MAAFAQALKGYSNAESAAAGPYHENLQYCGTGTAGVR